MDKTVSWIRRKDYRLLTVGLATYSSDDRFFTAHVRGPQDWALHVRFAQAQDAGLYECQVSTHPPASLFTELQLVGKLTITLQSRDHFSSTRSQFNYTNTFQLHAQISTLSHFDFFMCNLKFIQLKKVFTSLLYNVFSILRDYTMTSWESHYKSGKRAQLFTEVYLQ
ncbi:Limbic system-associated membrane protein, putative [Gryllus bimaculatus]|nr:Limbic system-associated membrane protein, putative [Gryllus bimaculatus]